LNTLVQAVNTSVHRSSHALCPVVSDKPDWFALFVRSKHEFAVEKELSKKHIETFIPTVQKFRQWTDRKKLIAFPLFPGYLFVHMNPCPEEFSKVLKTPGSVKLLSAGNGNPTPVPTEEILSLKIVLENTEHFDVYPYLKEGSRIRIKNGPLKGIEGILKMKENQYMCIINIEILGRSIGVKIYADDLEAL
jgi:transcription termination/antitermination protein NusG